MSFSARTREARKRLLWNAWRRGRVASTRNLGASAVITHALNFTGQSSTGQGGRTDSTVSFSGATALTASYFARIRDLDRLQWGMGEWGPNSGTDNLWIWAPSSSAEYGAGNDGMSFWTEGPGGVSRAYWGTDLDGVTDAVIHAVVRYYGAGATNADRVRIWSVVYDSDGSVLVAWGERTVAFAFQDPASAIRTQTSRQTHVGGATYGTSYDADGLIGLAAAWDSALTPAQILAMHDETTGQPTDVALLPAPVFWAQPTAADVGQTSMANRGSAGGTITFEEGTDGGQPTVVPWTLAD